MATHIQASFWGKNYYKTKKALCLNQENTFWHQAGFHMKLSQHKSCQNSSGPQNSRKAVLQLSPLNYNQGDESENERTKLLRMEAFLSERWEISDRLVGRQRLKLQIKKTK